jgi:beta-galactosidase
MRLRSVLSATGFGLLVAVGMLGASMPVHGAAPAPSSDTARSSTEIAKGWRFRFGGDAAGVTGVAYDDHDWATVDLPHTWNRIGEYGTTRSSTINDSHGIGWYRLHFRAPPRVAGRRQFLQFDAVGNVAHVWVNGAPVGTHAGAFSRFRFDVTDRLKPGEDSVIVVEADNSKPEVGATTENVIPLGGDFFVHGGIYRGVSLVDAAETQIDLLDHGGPGVYISTPLVAADRADVAVLVRLRNLGARDRALTLATEVVDATGREVATDSTRVMLAHASATSATRSVALPNPHLWRGRKDPYLYSLVVELRDGGKVVDRVKQSFGVRTFRFDANEGFFLNGEPTPLHGASRHQDRLGEGWALTPADHAEDMALMAEMGVNTIRHAHYQHAQEWVDAADHAGMIVWAEVPFVHESSLTNDAPTAALIDNARSQMTELIRQEYNHPAIVIWSIGNEVDIRPTQLGIDKPAQSLVVLQSLNALAKQEDPSRATAYADCCEDAQAIKGSQILSNVADITGYNRYFGWYYGQPAELGPTLDKFHARYPKMPVAVSEYGAGGATTQHTDNPQGGPVNVFGRPHPEEYESWVHEESWKVLEPRRWLAAVWIWNMFDFSSDLREEGDATYLNDKGMVTSDRGIRKDVFYFYKAQWSADPVLHITGRRYVDRAYPIVDVRAYSNAEHAVLFVNGEARGDAACPRRICVWREVALRSGRNEVHAIANVGGKSISDAVEWQAPDVARGVHVLAGTLTGATMGDGTRFGSDNFFVGGDGKSLNPLAKPGEEKTQKVVSASSGPAVYGAYREGAFRYEIPLPDGQWQVALYFVEPDAALAKTRTFEVSAGGKTMLAGFNPAEAAGGALKAIERRFVATAQHGHLVFDFKPIGGPAIVSAIAVAPK